MTQDLKVGPYALLEPLGKGGMGAVYRALHEDGREVALKILTLGNRDDGIRIARFRREAEAAQSLSHPGLVKVFDHGSDGERQYIAMELVRGTSLQALIQDYGPLALAHAHAVAVELLEALGACHAVGLLHRDVKPANVIVEGTPFARGRARLVDLGLVKPIDRTVLTEEGSVLGTPRYMPPEMLTTGESDRRGDIYQVALVFFEAVTGRPYHAGNGMREVVSHVLEGPPPEIPPELEVAPQGMRDFLSCALAREPEERFESAAVAIACLKRGASSAANRTLKDGVKSSPALSPGERTPVQGVVLSGRFRAPEVGSEPPPTLAPERARRLAFAGTLVGLVALAAVLKAGGSLRRAVPAGPVPQGVTVEAGPAQLIVKWHTDVPVAGVVTLPAVDRTAREAEPHTEHAVTVDRLMPETRYQVDIGDADGARAAQTATTRSVAGVVREVVQLLDRAAVDRLLAELRAELADAARRKTSVLSETWRARVAGRLGDDWRALAADFRGVRALVAEADVPVEARERLVDRLAVLADLDLLLRTHLSVDLGLRIPELLPPGLDTEPRLPVGCKPFRAVRFGHVDAAMPPPAGIVPVEAGEPAAFKSDVGQLLAAAVGKTIRGRYELPGPIVPPGRIERVYLGFRLHGNEPLDALVVFAAGPHGRRLLGRLSPAPDHTPAERFIRIDERAAAEPGRHLTVEFESHASEGNTGVKLYTLAIYVEQS